VSILADEEKDALYRAPLEEVGDFVFDSRVARVFPDMINRSVPAYATIIDMVGLLANRYAQANSNCYDLGCSLGATSFAIDHGVGGRGCTIIAVDNSEAMLDRFRQKIPALKTNIQLRNADVRDIEIERGSFVALNFTLQFIPLEDRPVLLNKIRQGMLPGGCLVLSEKISFDNPGECDFQDAMHALFKRANGYSDLEIAQKRSALENVLLRETADKHHSNLAQAGFSRSYTWFQCFNFMSFVAFRD
jgi:tRNA (cmo5U34)-methyltransferase